MKKFLLSVLSLAAFSGLTFGQFTYADFETVKPTTYPFGTNTGFEAGVANPSTTGNTSAKVAKVVKGAETWAGIAMPVGGSITFSATDTKFTMDVYSDVTGLIKFKIENAANTAEAAEVDANYTTANAWQTLEFDFGAAMDAAKYTQLVLFFDFGTENTPTFYFDNIKGPQAAMSGSVTVELKVNDKLGIANTVALKIAGEDVALTQSGNIWSAEKDLAPYNIAEGGGAYETFVVINGANVDTTIINVTGGAATMVWNYLLLQETPEDGTAKAISVGTTPPTIDGTIDAIWNNAKVHPLQQRSWWGTPTGLYSYYKIMWDVDNVYVLNYIDDETPVNNGSAPYENDNVELFFDMNQSADAGFDADDWQIRCVRGLDTWTGSANVETGTWKNDVQRAQKELDGSKGYVIEWAIPWTSLSGTFLPLATFEFNFDVVIADVADAAGRDYIISWATTADQNYNNTALFGTVTLDAGTVETSVKQTEVAGLMVYPNPVSDQLMVSAANNINVVNVFDVTGRMVSQLNNIGATSATVNMSSLNTGIYIVNIIDAMGNTSARKIQVH